MLTYATQSSMREPNRRAPTARNRNPIAGQPGPSLGVLDLDPRGAAHQCAVELVEGSQVVPCVLIFECGAVVLACMLAEIDRVTARERESERARERERERDIEIYRERETHRGETESATAGRTATSSQS